MALNLNINLPRKHFSLALEHAFANAKVTAIVGPSGSGKSSLLRCLAGLEPTCTGTISYNDEVWLDPASAVATCHRGVGFVTQNAYLFEHLRVDAQLEFAIKRSRHAKSFCEREEIIHELNLEHLLGLPTRQLSGGQRQLVALASALLSQPKLLLLDEPVSALDNANKRKVLKHLVHIKRHYQLTMLIVSHQPEELHQLADDLVYVNRGKKSFADSYIAALTDTVHDLANQQSAFSVVVAQYQHFDATRGLHVFNLGENKLYLVNEYFKAEPGSDIRIRIFAKDVSLCLSAPSDTSILNILKATIVALVEREDNEVLTTLDIEGHTVLTRISRYSSLHLGLKPGKELIAQVKALALP